jgi:hypothetical protein
MIQASPNLPCPYYQNTANYVSAAGQKYSVICGAEFGGGTDIATLNNSPSKEVIYTRFNATY